MQGFIFGVGLMAVGTCGLMRRERIKHAKNNLRKLEYMSERMHSTGNDQFVPPATRHERNTVYTHLTEQKNYLYGPWPRHIIHSPPKVEWVECPMDERYVEWLDVHYPFVR